jgi:pimeloyl-ACP methyl ester carboxylesterase
MTKPAELDVQTAQVGRRNFLKVGASFSGGAVLVSQSANAKPGRADAMKLVGQDHWTTKQVGSESIKLYLWRKTLKNPGNVKKGVILFIHGSSMAGTPVFDLQVPGKPQYSTMDYFAKLGFDTWCLDNEGYGRSDKERNINFNISNGADDIAAASEYIIKSTGQKQLMLYGLSSGALKAALFAERFPERVSRIALDAFVWTGEGSPTLEKRRQRIAEWTKSNRRSIDHAMIESIFTRDHPGTADADVVKAFADAILKLDTSVPTGTYVDMSINLPVCQPEKLKVPTMIMRGEFDGVAGFQDLVNYFAKLPNADKRFVVMPGIAHSSLHEKNIAIVHNVLENFFDQPRLIYRG